MVDNLDIFLAHFCSYPHCSVVIFLSGIADLTVIHHGGQWTASRAFLSTSAGDSGGQFAWTIRIAGIREEPLKGRLDIPLYSIESRGGIRAVFRHSEGFCSLTAAILACYSESRN